MLLKEMSAEGQLPQWAPQVENTRSVMQEGGVSSHDGCSALCPPEGARRTRHKACSISLPAPPRCPLQARGGW